MKSKRTAHTMVDMEPELYDRAKVEASRMGMTYTAFMVLLLRAYFGEVEFGRIRIVNPATPIAPIDNTAFTKKAV